MVSSFQDTPMEHTAFESLYVGKTNQQAREQVGWGGAAGAKGCWPPALRA